MKDLFTGRVCRKCVMDQSDPAIVFDAEGVCNHCHTFPLLVKKYVLKGAEGLRHWENTVKEITTIQRRRKYDVILGISGGTDSSYLAYLAKKYELRTLLVHFDNGWNSQIANKNIENIIKKTGFDFYTLVVDWEEFKDLQLSYFKADVIDIEALTDHAIMATLYRLAARHKIPFILSGYNINTEGILPAAWVYRKRDSWNIKDIHRHYGTLHTLKTFPFYTFWGKKWYNTLLKFEKITPLNWIDYNKYDAQQVLRETFGWQDYGGKHYESVFTRFYQSYILPGKFGVDKRKAHLSTLIVSGQLTREEALRELEKPILEEKALQHDKTFVLNKLGFGEKEFEEYMHRPQVPHTRFIVEPVTVKEYLKALLTGKRIYA